MKIKMKQNLKRIGINAVALILLVIILSMYPLQSFAFENFFKQNITNNADVDFTGDSGSLEWGNVFKTVKSVTTNFEASSKTGVTIEATTGSPVLAPSSGKVTKSEWTENNNYILEVVRSDGKSWVLKNLINQPTPRVGDTVLKGQEVAYVGTTGKLIVEVYDEVPINPESVINFSVAGISTGVFSSKTKNNLLLSDYKKSIYSGEFFYKGIPEGHSTKSKTNGFKWVVNFLYEITDYLLGLVVSVFNLGVLGWGILAEVVLTEAFDSLTVRNVGSGSYRKNNAGFYTDSKRTVNIENLLFNRVEVLNVNFFESKESVKERLLKYSPTGLEMEELYGEGYEEEIEVEDGPLLVIKDYFASIFKVLYQIGLLLLLIALLINAIMAIMESVAVKKATYKKRAISWAKAFVEMLLLVVYMIVILQVHTTVINLLSKFADALAETVGGTYIQTDMGRNYTILETLRTRAYSLKLTVSVPATIMYIVLIWYTFKFILMYTKRFLVVFFLSLLGPLLMIYDLIIVTIKGKSSVRTDWIKEYTFNVLIQIVHAFVYVIFIPITYGLASKSIVGFIIMFILLKFLLEADKIIRQIFSISGAKKHSTLDNVLEKSTLKDYTAGLVVGSLFNKKNISRGSSYISKVTNPVKAVIGTAGSTVFRGAYNLREYAGERRRARRIEEGLDAQTEAQKNRQKKKDQKVEDILKLQGYSDDEIDKRMNPRNASYKQHALTEEEKDKIRLLDSSKVMKTNMIIRGVRKAQYNSNRFKRVLKDMGTVDKQGRHRIKGKEYYFDFDEKKIKSTQGTYDKFRDSVIKEFNMGKGEKGREEYRRTIADFKKAGTFGLKASAGILFFPISFADSTVSTGLFYGLLGNFQFNSKAFQQKKGNPYIVEGNARTDEIKAQTKSESKKTVKEAQKVNKKIYKENKKNRSINRPEEEI